MYAKQLNKNAVNQYESILIVFSIISLQNKTFVLER